MSQLLSQSFSNLKIAPAPATQMQLPNPTNLHPNGRVCFYGYDVLEDWLIHYAKNNFKDYDQYDDLALMSIALQILKARTRIETIEFEAALPDATAPTDTAITGHRRGEPMVPILSICTTEVGSYRKRPSQAQVDQLSQILGRQPRWWIDYEHPSSYQ